MSKLVRGSFIRTSFDTLCMKLFQYWLQRFFRIALGFLKRYVTPSYLKGLRNGSWSKLEVWKKHQFYFIEGTFFCTSNFDQLPFLSPLSYKEVTYLYRKPKAILNESSNQNWKHFIHSVSKLVWMKKYHFLLEPVFAHCGESYSNFECCFHLELLWAFQRGM